MFFEFNTFTRIFFYSFVCYQYARLNYPEKTQKIVVLVCYNGIYLYGKLQILFCQKSKQLHNFLLKYKEYQKAISFLEKLQEQFNTQSQSQSKDEITMDFISQNKIILSFEKNEFKNHCYIDDNIIDYDFIIANGGNNLKKIIKRSDLIKNGELILEDCDMFELKPLQYQPLLCEFLNGDGSVIKIDFCDNKKSYNFFVIDNCFDEAFLIYFMKKYYDVDVKEKYILKVLDSDVNTFLFDSSDILKLDEKFICKLNK
jgi:hypothetical protein